MRIIDDTNTGQELVGTNNDDYIDGGSGNDTIEAGDGTDLFTYKLGDGKDTITDYAEGEDTIQITGGVAKISTSGNDVILTIGNGSILVQDGVGKTITYSDADGPHTYPDAQLEVNTAGTAVTLLSGYTSDTFNVTTNSDVAAYANKIKTIDATQVEHSLTITGNSLANTVYGTSQDDAIN